MQLLSDAAIAKLPAPETGTKTYRDSKQRGLGVRVYANGSRSFCIDYVVRATGARRIYVLGVFGPWKLAAARAEAKRLRDLIVHHEHDPLGQRTAAREAPTFQDAWDDFKEAELEPENDKDKSKPANEKAKRKPKKLSPKTWEQYESLASLYLLPSIGAKKFAAVTNKDMTDLHRKISKPSQADAAVVLVKLIYNRAIKKWGWQATNPALGIVEKPVERERYLSDAESARFVTEVAACEDRQAADILTVLLFTGCRRNEVLGAKWAEMDLHAHTWSLPGHRTKTKTRRLVPLTPPVLTILTRIQDKQAEGETFVFPGEGKTGHREGVRKPFEKIRRAAKLEDFHLHDIRHNFASIGVSAGLTLPQIGGLLGHTSQASTQRYAHLMPDAATKAANTIAAVIAGNKSATVVPLQRKRK